MSRPHSSSVVLAAAFVVCVCAPRAAFAAPPNPCTLLTQAQVSAALETNVGAGTLSLGKICRWAAPGGTPGRSPAVVLTMQDAQAFNFAKSPAKSANLVKTPASGVGDDAVFNTIGGLTATLTVKQGETYFELHVYGFGVEQTQSMEKTLALEIVAKLKQ